jgi:hypothetical protein
MSNEDYDIWLVGNSTLGRGVAAEMLSDTTGRRVAKFMLGSSSFEAQVNLAEYMLRSTKHRPKYVGIFATKDDFNRNGWRYLKSQKYLRAMHEPRVEDILASQIPVYACRTSIKRWLRGERGEAASASTDGVPIHDLSEDWDTQPLANDGRDYQWDGQGWQLLNELTANYPNIRFFIVLPPVTKSIERWQAAHCPYMPWRSILSRIHHKAAQIGVPVYDHADLLPSTSEFFRDNYHVNLRGQARFTRKLSAEVREMLFSGSSIQQAARPSSQLR